MFGEEGKTFVHRVMDYRALRIFEIKPATVIGACSLQAKAATRLFLNSENSETKEEGAKS